MTYATSGDYTAFTGQPAPVGTDRLLARASEVIDGALFAAVYRTNSSGAALDPEVVNALRDATCAQVEFWQAGDEEDDVLGPTQGYAVGGLSVQYGAGDNRVTPTYLAPRAARLLRACPHIHF